MHIVEYEIRFSKFSRILTFFRWTFQKGGHGTHENVVIMSGHSI